MTDKIYSTDHLDAYLRGEGVLRDFDSALQKDREANRDKFLAFIRDGNKMAALQMLDEEREFYTKTKYEYLLYAQKSKSYRGDNQLLESAYYRMYLWGRDLFWYNLKNGYAPGRLIVDVLYAAIQSKDIAIIKSLFELPQLLDYFNKNLYIVLSSAGNTTKEVAAYLIRTHEIYLREQIRLKLKDEGLLDPARYGVLLDAAVKVGNIDLVKFLLAKLIAPNFQIYPIDLLSSCLRYENYELLIMLLNYKEFSDNLKYIGYDKLLKINHVGLMSRLESLGVFDDEEQSKEIFIAAAMHSNIAALNIILAPERAELMSRNLADALTAAVRSDNHISVYKILKNQFMQKEIYELSKTTSILNEMLRNVSDRSHDTIDTSAILLVDPVLCSIAMQNVMNGVRARLRKKPLLEHNMVDFRILSPHETNLLYCLLREPVMFEIFTASTGLYDFMPLEVQQCMDIYRDSLISGFKFQNVNAENAKANLTMFLTFVSRATLEELPAYATIFAEQILPYLVKDKGKYINLIPFTENNFAVMLKYLSAEDMQNVIGLTDHPIHRAWLLDVLLNQIDFANENSGVMLLKIADILQNHYDRDTFLVVKKFIEQGKYLPHLLLAMDQVDSLKGYSSCVGLALMLDMSNMMRFPFMNEKITEANLDKHLEYLCSSFNCFLPTVKFMVEMTKHLNSIYYEATGIDDKHKDWGDVALKLHDVKTLAPESVKEDQMPLLDALLTVNTKLEQLQNYLSSLSVALDKYKIKPPEEFLDLQHALLHPKQKYPGLGALRY